MRIALTGAGGFTGRFVTAVLDAADIEWVALDVDLADADAVDRIVADTAFDRLIHLAAKAFVNASDWRGFYTVNQLGTLNLLDAIARHREGTRCVLSSSAQVYGPTAKGLIAENTFARPANHYAISKHGMEQAAKLWDDRLDLIITRPFNYTGVGQGTEYLIPKLVDHFRRRAPVIELGNSWVRRDFGDVRSVAEAYAELIMAEQAPPLVNICTGSVWSIEDLLAILSEISGHNVEIRTNPAFVRANDVAVLGGDVTLLQRTLPGWKPRNIAETLAWMYASKAG